MLLSLCQFSGATSSLSVDCQAIPHVQFIAMKIKMIMKTLPVKKHSTIKSINLQGQHHLYVWTARPRRRPLHVTPLSLFLCIKKFLQMNMPQKCCCLVILFFLQDSLLRLQVCSAWYDGGTLHRAQTGQ